MAEVLVLRYPYQILAQDTDYLQIDLISKSYAGSGADISIGAVSFGSGSKPTKGTAKDNIISKTLIRNKGFANVSGTGREATIATDKFITKSDGIIILPIPSNIADSNSVNYSEDKLDAITATAGSVAYNLMRRPLTGGIGPYLKGAGETIAQSVQASGLEGGDAAKVFLGNLAAQAAGLAGVGNLTLDQILARSEGQIVNPNMELLFNGPTIRSFKFSFKMTPRDGVESKQIRAIIGTLKRHMAPQDGSSKAFLGTPNFFELRYKSGKGNHEFLNKIKQCVLQDMSVNYTGENVYATYADGTPVSIIMDLTFKELEPIYSSDYSDDVNEGVGY